MGTNGKDVMDALKEPAAKLRELIPNVYAGYTATHRAVFTDGALDRKTKELIALAVAVATRCDGCIASHARGAARMGATPDEVAEALGVTILMQGGPGTVYAPRALDAFYDYYQAPAGNE
ncbi:MAG: carboxymuconolactone decarboxylase family protein [Actinomycetes bacterium]